MQVLAKGIVPFGQLGSFRDDADWEPTRAPLIVNDKNAPNTYDRNLFCLVYCLMWAQECHRSVSVSANKFKSVGGGVVVENWFCRLGGKVLLALKWKNKSINITKFTVYQKYQNYRLEGSCWHETWCQIFSVRNWLHLVRRHLRSNWRHSRNFSGADLRLSWPNW